MVLYVVIALFVYALKWFISPILKVAYLGIEAKLELKMKISMMTLAIKKGVGEMVLILKVMHVVLES